MKKRFILSVIETAGETMVVMPWQRGPRRMAMIDHREGEQREARSA